MEITFNGAAHTVTGSQYLLKINGHTLLLECGLYQGKRAEAFKRNRDFYFPVDEVDAVILSHAHIDHSGNLPNLVKNGYSGPIFATKATARLSELMLLDAGHIQESDVQFVNRKRERRGEEPLEPLYTVEDAARVPQYFERKNYNETFSPIPSVVAHFVDAGHILGSAAVVLDIEEKGRKFRFWFSGDIGRVGMPLLKDPVLPENVDYLMMESTYGDKLHEPPEEAYLEFSQVVNRTVQRGGKVIIPAFAVGRTQELVYIMRDQMEAGLMPRVPIYVDSPLAVSTSRVFEEFPELFDEETHALIRNQAHPILQFSQVHYTQNVNESKALNDRKEPMVIISASGMAEVGRILHHLRNNIENPRNTIAIVGWQAPDTLGRRLAERAPMVNIFGEPYHRRAEVATIGGLSAHAGQDFLLKYARAANGNLKKLFLVHGEQAKVDVLIGKLNDAGIKNIVYPDMRQVEVI